MNWDKVRKIYPNQWVLIEALKAHSDSGKRLLDQLSVLNSFSDSLSAMQSYKHIHKNSPQRELYVIHTQKESLNIEERTWAGIRGTR
ncbi:MAG: hypothetical protein HN936_13990 [Bacteroidetes bacterium]|nr:hypothetical protein [Bacteroidota bacterium]